MQCGGLGGVGGSDTLCLQLYSKIRQSVPRVHRGRHSAEINGRDALGNGEGERTHPCKWLVEGTVARVVVYGKSNPFFVGSLSIGAS